MNAITQHEGPQLARAATPGVLLTAATAYGTLAAARSLDRAGIDVVMADPDWLAPGLWSRAVKHSLRCPDASTQPEAFVQWLLDFGARAPGTVLYATTDDVAWLMARNRERLARNFLMYQPPLAATTALLNKWQLSRACAAVGLETPRTWLPEDDTALRHVREDSAGPWVIKPQTQALFASHQKGQLVRDGRQLEGAYHAFEAASSHALAMRQADPGISRPLVQAFCETAADHIYNLSGFIDETGSLCVARASRKVLQWPYRLGIGLCFEAAEVQPELSAGVARLCRRVGHYGAFEVEFVEASPKHWELIDFNPRFYGELGFDVARGLDLPRLVYLAATGQHAALQRAVELMGLQPPREDQAWCNRLQFELVLGLRRVAGVLPPGEAERWRAWLWDHRRGLVDAVLDRRDWRPALVDGAMGVLARARHPRGTWRAAHEA